MARINDFHTAWAETFKALSAPERLHIVEIVSASPCTPSELAEQIGTNPINVFHHLGILCKARILVKKKSGRFVYYSLSPTVRHDSDKTGTTLRIPECGLRVSFD
ncbi:MAG: metalloregulator ArsR/SmtB family transcription factor [Gemmataceae bacterium]